MLPAPNRQPVAVTERGVNVGTTGNMVIGLTCVGIGVWAIEWRGAGSTETILTIAGAFFILFGLYRAILAMVNIGT